MDRKIWKEIIVRYLSNLIKIIDIKRSTNPKKAKYEITQKTNYLKPEKILKDTLKLRIFYIYKTEKIDH